MRIKVLRPVHDKFPITSGLSTNRTLTIDGKTVSRPHNGIDFGCPVDTPIRAVADGRIVRAGWENEKDPKQGYGLRIYHQIKIPEGTFFVVYAHLNRMLVHEGDKVEQGEIIADSGHTGRSSGPHLHIGARHIDTSEWFDMEFLS